MQRRSFSRGSLIGGYLSAILSAVAFGFIPLFSVPLLEKGYSPTLILLYRTSFSAIGVALFMLFRKISFHTSFRDIPYIILGGILYFFSSWFLLIGYKHVYSGLATTIHFSYPIFITLFLLLGYGFRPTLRVLSATLLALAGVSIISLLGSSGSSFYILGIRLIILSGIAYAFYIIELRYSRLSRFPGFRITFYVMLIGSCLFALISLLSPEGIQILSSSSDITNVLLLALVPTILSNLLLIYSVQRIGSRKASILGAMEPLTALTIGVLVFNEPISPFSMLGTLFIIISVYLIITDKEKEAV